MWNDRETSKGVRISEWTTFIFLLCPKVVHMFTCFGCVALARAKYNWLCEKQGIVRSIPSLTVTDGLWALSIVIANWRFRKSGIGIRHCQAQFIRGSESLDPLWVPKTEIRNNKFVVILSTTYRVLLKCPNMGRVFRNNMTTNLSIELISWFGWEAPALI